MGRLGKLQKSKKHKKIKAIDPFYVGKRGKDREVKPVNSKPVNFEEQEMPRKVVELMEFKLLPVNRKKKKKRAGIQEPMMEKGMTKPLPAVPKFKQRKGESEHAFFNRMDRETQEVIAKAQFEDKYKVDLNAIEKGEVKVKKKKKKISERKRERQKERKVKQKIQKTNKVEKKATGFEKLEDNVKFGEVAMEPPTLTAKPKQASDIAKPGRKSLLLKEVIRDNQSHNINKSVFGPKSREVGQTVKRKHLSFAQQRLVDGEREKAIETYRLMKAKRQKVS
ncbi:coiled-coil domain-containing protein 137 isoform X2 [Lingula anatina]|uniref:Coiled-coil domain-containing protein 137 isoform X2 n=1 Tax=Lingula anatina TaxID=7574 RepID=A0A1S3HLN4_LINAN|nr:coiled-coil domain-containing protein 137 isoform X2 [Lingula anatina]|eukprot:XP_013387013.1 coiled-coil domain-containing protein 137 isoform X2 [Lingula anatina]